MMRSCFLSFEERSTCRDGGPTTWRLNQIRTDRLSLIDNADLNDAVATAFEQWSLARSEAMDVMRLYFAGSQWTRHGGMCSSSF